MCWFSTTPGLACKTVKPMSEQSKHRSNRRSDDETSASRKRGFTTYDYKAERHLAKWIRDDDEKAFQKAMREAEKNVERRMSGR